MSQQPASPATPSTQTTRLLACGIVAGPLFLAVVLVQAVTRQGFDLGRHPISLLSLRELGGSRSPTSWWPAPLMVACAVGMRRVLHPGPGGAWGPLLVGAFGVGLVIAGVFVVDPGAGFPPGAPAGAPERLSWHGILHEVGFGLANLAMLVGCVVFMRRFAARRQWDWVGACVATVVAVLVLVSWPDPDGLSVRLVLAAAILFGFVAALAARLLRGLPNAAGPSAAARRAGRLRRAG